MTSRTMRETGKNRNRLLINRTAEHMSEPSGQSNGAIHAAPGPGGLHQSFSLRVWQRPLSRFDFVRLPFHLVLFASSARAITNIVLIVVQKSLDGVPDNTLSCEYLRQCTAHYECYLLVLETPRMCLSSLSLFAFTVTLRSRVSALSSVPSHPTHPSLAQLCPSLLALPQRKPYHLYSRY